MNISKLNKVIDGIQSFLVWFVITIITVCIAVLLVFDVLAGTGTMLFLTGNKEWQSVVISLATTGLLFALMFIGYMLVTKTKNQLIAGVGRGVMGASAILYVTDVIFDALLADILRYGLVATQVDWLQWAFRGVVGGISTVGDGLAIAMILGMPVLKIILQDALKDNTSTNNNRVEPQRQPNPQTHYQHQNYGGNREERHNALRQAMGGQQIDIPPFLQQNGGKKGGNVRR